MRVDDFVNSMLREEGGFQKGIRNILEELEVSLNEFCHMCQVSQSTMYKIVEEDREPNLRTVRQVVKTLRALEVDEKQNFVAILASHRFMENLPHYVDVRGTSLPVKEYAVSTVEDAIIAAVRAEREGALAVICAPIVEPTIQKILAIPVAPIFPYDSVISALNTISRTL